MTSRSRTITAIALAITAFCAPGAVNATYSDAAAAHAPLTAQAAAARKAYSARETLENETMHARAHHTRKTLVAVMATLQSSCDASCTMTH